MYKKKLLVYAHYYYPDVASTGQILTELCEGLQESFDITVICVVPSYNGEIDEKYRKNRFYKERINNVNIIRVRVPRFNKKKKISRVVNLLVYFLNSIIATIRLERYDYIFSISQPPILGGLLGVIGKYINKGKFIYNIQDFNPEQTKAIGYTRNKLIINMALLVDKFSCKQANKIIVVGRDMRETLKNRFKGKTIPDNIFINNWIDEKSIYSLNSHNTKVMEFKKKYGIEDKFIIMYSGNIGLYYDLDNIVKVMSRFKERLDVFFVFVGDGTVKRSIEDYVVKNNIENIKFIPYQKKSDLNYSLNAADIQLVVNSKGIKGVSVPSKLYGVMACGKAVFGILEKGSEARIIIEEAKCGICSEPGNYEEIYEKINYILKNKETILPKGKNGREFLERKLTKELAISKYKESILNV